MSEVHLIIVWSNAGHQFNDIIDDLSNNFVVKDVFEITWTKDLFASNLTRFYGQSLPIGCDKEVHVGNGPFRAIVFVDNNPQYDVCATTKGNVSVNTNVFFAKQKYREWGGGGHRIHGTNCPKESFRDIWFILGRDSVDFLTHSNWNGKIVPVLSDLLGANGWRSIDELFKTLNRFCNYVVLRNFEPLPLNYHLEEHGDIDLLVSDLDECVFVSNATKAFEGTNRVHYFINISGKLVPFDFRYVGDGYYDTAFQFHLLSGRELLRDCFYAPTQNDYFFSLLYHALIHKPVFSEDYADRLCELALKIDVCFDGTSEHAAVLLARYFYENDYTFVPPVDTTVFFNQKWVPVFDDIPATPQNAAEIVDNAKDLSLLSGEIQAYCTDWAHMYHLGRARANVLRPFERLLKNVDVLEIGAGCGAITRFLGECGARTTAIERNSRRAAIARSRTRDLENVCVFEETFSRFRCDKKFDVITMIGVLEYANVLVSGKDPLSVILERVRSLLKPEGLLIVAIENRLGLKYFAGAPEGHVWQPMYGIEGRYGKHQPQTFSKKVLAGLLARAGFVFTKFLAPFPDYKFASSIVTERGIAHDGFDSSALAWQSVVRDCQMTVSTNFSLELAWPEIFSSGLALEMANSFLIVSSPSISPHGYIENNILGYHYSMERLRQFCKETTFLENISGDVAVSYRQFSSVDKNGMELLMDERALGVNFRHELPATNMPYFAGKSLAREFIEIVSRRGWEKSDVTNFVRRYLNAIADIALLQESVAIDFCIDQVLPGKFLDLLPQNIIEVSPGRMVAFDLEWVSTDEITLGYLLFRGLFTSLGGVSGFEKSNDLLLTSWKEFIQQATDGSGITISDKKYLEYVLKEIQFRQRVTNLPAGSPEVLMSYKLPVLASKFDYDAAVAGFKTVISERDTVMAERDAMMAERDAMMAERDAMMASSSWYITKPFRFLRRLVTFQLASEDRHKLTNMCRNIYHKLPLPVPAKKLVSFVYHKGGVKIVSLLRRGLFRTMRFSVPRAKLAVRVDNLPDYIVWGVVDWHFRHQRPQQLALKLAATGRRVFYISPNFSDDERGGFRVEPLDDAGLLFQIKLFAKGAPVIYRSAPGVQCVSQLRASIGELLSWANNQQVISLVQHPFWHEVASVLPNSRLVYDCMDHHAGFGNNAESLLSQEVSLLQEAELTVTTSEWLDKTVAPYSKRRALIRNAGDFDHFSNIPENVYQDPQGRRVIGYFGAIAEWLDLDLVKAVAEHNPECCVLLIGADTCDAKNALGRLPNIVFTGEVPYSKLPYYLYSFDVCLLPFMVNELTLATNPVKVYEFLCAGKPVVSIALPEMVQFDGLVYLADGKEAFLTAVRSVLSQPESDALVCQRKAFAREQTWQQRVEALIEHAESSVHDARVSVVLVTYNNLDFSSACLMSLDQHSQYAHIEIIVVDNASDDGSRALLTEWVAKGHNRKLILNDENKGFAAANNQGLALATGEYLVLLNNDTYVTPGWIRTLMGHLKRDKTIGLIGPVTNNIGNEAKIEIAYADMDEMLLKSFIHTRRHIGELYSLRTAAFFCVMMPRTTYERIGALDEAFGRGFFEDDDYCRRIEQRGLRVVCAEDVFIHHHLSASFDKLKQQDRRKLFEENKKTYEAKWGKWVPHSFRSPLTWRDVIPNVFDGQNYVEGHCVVCGKDTRFYYQDVSFWRETLNCQYCRTTSRYRSIARGLLRAINGLAGVNASCLATLPRFNYSELRVYDTQTPFYYDPCSYPLPDLLKATGWIKVELSNYKPNKPLGVVLSKGVTNQNLEQLTFLDESFDIVITSDVMEHVRLDDRAHREIFRVLKPGGIYLFTVPHIRSMEKTLIRVQTPDPDDPRKDVHLLEPEYHGDTNSDGGDGVLAYRTYGRDIEERLREIGFEVDYSREDQANEGILSTELYYCKKCDSKILLS